MSTSTSSLSTRTTVPWTTSPSLIVGKVDAESGTGWASSVDAALGREVARRRQALGGLRLAVGDRTANLGRGLLVQVGGFGAVELDAQHGASNNSFIS